MADAEAIAPTLALYKKILAHGVTVFFITGRNETSRAATIQAASIFSLPVSTTHVLTAGVLGAMFAQGSGLQRDTVWKIVAAWVLTLPVSIFLASALFGAFTFVLLKSLVIY